MIGERNTADTSIEELSELMVGHKVATVIRESMEPGETVLEMDHVSLKSANGVQVLKDISLSIREHEILGIAGVEGNGQMELIEVLSALCPSWEGEILYKGKRMKGRTTAELLEDGVSCIHADRQAYSIAMDLEVPENFLMGYQQTPDYRKRKWLVDWGKVVDKARAMLEHYDVRPRDVERKLSEFSGGNQQKFVVGREMQRSPKFMIAAHPTRGVDIMATAFIHDQLNRQKKAGGCVLLISSDLDELMQMSDRIAVIYDGRIVDCRAAEEYTTMELGRLMGGGQADGKA